MTKSQTHLSIFVGDNRFLIDDQVSQQGANLASHTKERVPESKSLNELVLDLKSVSMFQGNRWFIQHNPKWLFSALTKAEETHLEELLEGIKLGKDHLTLVITKTLDRRKKAVKKVLAHAQLMSCDGFKDWEQPKCRDWLFDRARRENIALSSAAGDLLMDVYGIQVDKLAQALMIAHIYTLNENRAITPEDIRHLFPEAHSSLYTMTEALKKGEYSQFYNAVTQLLTQKVDPIYLMAIILSQLRLFTQVICSGGISMDQLAKKIGKNPYFLKRIQQDIRSHISPKRLKKMYEDASVADLKIKTGQMNPQAAVRQFCGQMIG